MKTLVMEEKKYRIDVSLIAHHIIDTQSKKSDQQKKDIEKLLINIDNITYIEKR